MTRHHTYERTVPAYSDERRRECAESDPRHVAEHHRRIQSMAAWVAMMEGPKTNIGKRNGTKVLTSDGRVFYSMHRCALALGVPLSRLQRAMAERKPVNGVTVTTADGTASERWLR